MTICERCSKHYSECDCGIEYKIVISRKEAEKMWPNTYLPTLGNKNEMEKEHVYLRNLIDVHLDTADVFLEEGSVENAIHRLQHADYYIRQLVKLLRKEKE